MFNKLSSEGIRGNKAGTLLRKTFERDILKINHLCLKRPGWFMPGEIEKAAKHLGLTPRLFFIMYLGIYQWEKGPEFGHDVFILRPAVLEFRSFKHFSNQKGTCIFYENKLCCINCVKPFGCTLQVVEYEDKVSIAKAWNTPKNQKQIADLLTNNEPMGPRKKN